MKTLISAILILFSSLVQAATEITIDPTKETAAIICTLPTEREDNTQIGTGEITAINFYVDVNDAGNWTQVATSPETCYKQLDLAAAEDGTYRYKVTAVSAYGESQLSEGQVTVLVKRGTPAAPKAPGNLEVITVTIP